jgi:hypothetical protein
LTAAKRYSNSLSGTSASSSSISFPVEAISALLDGQWCREAGIACHSFYLEHQAWRKFDFHLDILPADEEMKRAVRDKQER